MSVEKLSVSMEVELLKLVRSAAAEEGLSLSTWLADAARAKAQQAALRAALDDHAHRHGELGIREAERIVDAARAKSVVTKRRARRA